MDDSTKTMGIALGGGGSLGSYEMGVWQALRELNIQPKVITGTSIGALIGAFWAADKYVEGQNLWQNVRPEKVMKDGINLQWEALVKTFKYQRRLIFTFTKRYIKNKGADISPFIDLIKANISPKEIKQAKVKYGIVTVSLPLLKQHNVVLADVPDDEVYDWLFASAAIWPLFPVKVIKGKTYIDGGYKDSLPIQFAFDLGATKVIAVNLFYRINWHPLLNRRSDVINIEPSWNLGMSFNFTQKIIDRNQKLGYNDAMKKLGGFIGYRYTFFPYDELIDLDNQLQTTIDTHFSNISNQIMVLLKRHTGGKMKQGQMFLRGLEILAETLRYDPTPIYKVDELARLLYRTLWSVLDNHRLIDILKKIQLGKHLSPKDEKTALEAIKYVLEKKYHESALPLWTTKKAKYSLTYMMLRLINKNFNRTINI